MANTKILIIDDDINICELLRLYLEKDGFEVDVITDGLKAIDAFNAIQPNLVLLDIMLPGMDGWQICREIRKDSQTPIMMLTAKGETFDKVLGLELGADEYITKPFETKEVVARIKAVLRRVSSQNPAIDTIKEVSFDGETVHVECSEAVAIHAYVGSKGPAWVRAHPDNPITSADLKIDPRCKYVRVSVMDKYGRFADTRGFTREELGLVPAE